MKAPKVDLSDSGIVHRLLDIEDHEGLERHPKVGASFEGFAIEQLVRCIGAEPEQCFTWALHSGAALDLLVVRGQARLGFEIKHGSTPTVTRSMRTAVEVLGLARLDVVYVGDDVFPLTDRIRAVGIEALDTLLS